MRSGQPHPGKVTSAGCHSTPRTACQDPARSQGSPTQPKMPRQGINPPAFLSLASCLRPLPWPRPLQGHLPLLPLHLPLHHPPPPWLIPLMLHVRFYTLSEFSEGYQGPSALSPGGSGGASYSLEEGPTAQPGSQHGLGGCPKATHSHLPAPMCLAHPQPRGAQMRAGHWAWEAKSPCPFSEVRAGPSWPQAGMQAQPATPAAIWFPSARPGEA